MKLSHFQNLYKMSRPINLLTLCYRVWWDVGCQYTFVHDFLHTCSIFKIPFAVFVEIITVQAGHDITWLEYKSLWLHLLKVWYECIIWQKCSYLQMQLTKFVDLRLWYLVSECQYLRNHWSYRLSFGFKMLLWLCRFLS